VKEKIYVMLNQAVLMLGSLFVLKLLTNYLSVDQFGIYSLILSVMALVAILPFNSVSQANIRYFSIYQNKRKLPEFIHLARKWFVLFSFFYGLLFLISALLLNYDWKLLTTIYFLIIAEVAKTSLRGIVNSARKRKNVAISGLIEFTLKLVLIYLAYKYIGLNIYWTIAIFIVANMFSIYPVWVSFIRTTKKPKDKFKNILEKRMFWFSLPLIIWGVFGWARDMSNRWYLEWFVDTESVAIFTVLASIALILPTAIQSLVNAYYIPIIYQKENKQPGYTAKFMNRFAIYFVVFSSFLAFFLSIFSSEVVVLFSSAVYVDYAPALTWMVFAYSLYILSSIMAIEVFAAKKTFYLLLPNIVPGIISMLLGYYMIKKYGLDGAFYSYLITYSAYAVLMFATIYVFRRKELALERIS
jgi:O-antigen/teichoic acid export membrane protein